MPESQQDRTPHPEPCPSPAGHPAEPTAEVGNLTVAAALVALVTGFYGFLVALYIVGSLGVGVMLRRVGFGPEKESWAHWFLHACMVAGGVLLLVLLLGAAALLAARSDDAPP